jgi:hypothetical protein
MRYCHPCDCQFPDEQESCLHCGAPLHDEPRTATGEAGDADSIEGLVLLTSMDPFESRRLLDRLAEAGIRFAVVNDEAARRVSRRRTGGFAGVNILVTPDQHAAASEIQQRVLRESLPDLPEDFEPAPDGAESCPACSAPLAGDAQCCDECGLEFPDVNA